MVLRTRELGDTVPFTTLPRDQQTAVLRLAQVRTYRHGERVLHGDDGCTAVTILLDGFVHLFRTSLNGAEVTTAIIAPGSIVAMAMLRGSALHDAHADAIGRVRTIEIPASTFLDLMRRNPRFAEAVAWGLVARTDDTFMDATKDAHGELWLRILCALHKLARPTHPTGDDGAMLRLAYRLSHAEIARLVGAHRSSVTRALRLLAERGCVRLEHGHVTGVQSESCGADSRLRDEWSRRVLG